MSDVIQEARRLKSKAIAARDKGDFARAESSILEAETMLRAALKGHQESREAAGEQAGALKPGAREIQVAEQLGHVLGSKGGIYRRWKKYEASADAYDQAYHFEKWVLGHGIDNSYVLVQRLVARVFIDPKAVQDDVEVRGLPLRRQLLEAEAEVERQQRGQRNKDEYAAADLALVRLLLGEANWESALTRFTQATPPPSAYSVEATLEVVNELRQTLTEKPDTPAGLVERLAQAGENLAQALRRLKGPGSGT
jgi:tetratricopeptide (TPR) repeat protein